jgi:hypothetical protein
LAEVASIEPPIELPVDNGLLRFVSMINLLTNELIA